MHCQKKTLIKNIYRERVAIINIILISLSTILMWLPKNLSFLLVAEISRKVTIFVYMAKRRFCLTTFYWNAFIMPGEWVLGWVSGRRVGSIYFTSTILLFDLELFWHCDIFVFHLIGRVYVPVVAIPL